MATESVTTVDAAPTQAIDGPVQFNAYERLHKRVRGIQAVSVLAINELESDTINAWVWQDLWWFVSETMNEIDRDAELLYRRRD